MIVRFPEEMINQQPAEKEWSAANIADHLTKSNLSIARALQLQGSTINRDPGEKIPELKSVFLDRTNKFEAPSFIIPGVEPMTKETAISAFIASCDEITGLASQVELSEMINHKAFGDITKLEILHFVVFHTMRHTVQLEKTFSIISQKNIK
jgi:hypothetical protein